MKSYPGRNSRIGMALLGAVACMALLQPPTPARGQTVPRIDRAQVTSATHNSVTINWTAAPGEEAGLEVTVFYGSEDGGMQKDKWPHSAALVPEEEAKTQYHVTLGGLEPETAYVYRICASSPAGAAWSPSAVFETEPWALPGYVLLLIVAVLLTVPFVVGNRLARRFRMPDYGWKIGLIFCTLACGLTVIGFRWPPGLGIDLSGGTILTYEIDQEKKKDPNVEVDMEKMVTAVAERVNPGGQKEMTIRALSGEQIEVIIPHIDAEEAKRVERIIGRVGSLEFRILANNRDHKNLIDRALREDTAVLTRLGEDGKEVVVARWVPVQAGREEDFEGYLNAPQAQREIGIREMVRHGERVLEVLVVKDTYDVTDEFLDDARRGYDNAGNAKVDFRFDGRGARLFGRLTSTNLPVPEDNFYRKLGIILDGRLYSAPRIMSAIYGNGEITMGTPRTNRERQRQESDVDDLVRVLNAGGLPTALSQEPISRLVTGPTLGRDTIIKGCWAIGISAVLVLLFMLLYYRFAGIIACAAVLTNLVMILAIMMFVNAAFTLPGLAGLVLTVGMAVDANVLIFERIREELGRGAALRMAIRNGFNRATTAIVDSNVTTLIIGVILYAVGAEAVKGFAITLVLGVLMSMYTAIFCSRVVFDIGERRRWISKLTMMQMFGETRIDFLGKRRLAIGCSLVVIVAGLAGVVYRGVGLLDIDFTGGESVVVTFDKPVEIRKVRDALLGGLPDLAVSGVEVEGGTPETWYRVNTSQSTVDIEKLSDWGVESLRKQLEAVFGAEAGTDQRNKAIEEFRRQLTRAIQTDPSSDQQKPAIEAIDKTLAELFSDAPQGPKAEAALDMIRRDVNRIARVNTAIEYVEEYLHHQFLGQLAANTMKYAEVAALGAAEGETTDSTPEGPALPAAGDQARRGLPGGGPLAMASLAPLLLAQTGPPEAEDPAIEPAAEQPPSETADDESPDEPPSPAGHPEPTTDGSAAEPGVEATQPGGEAPRPSGQTTEPTEPTTGAPAASAQARLTFANEVGYDTVLEMFVTEFGSEDELPSLSLAPLVESPNPSDPPTPDSSFVVGDTTKYKIWDVDIELPPEEARARLESIAATVADTPFFPSSNTIGSKVAGSTQLRGIYALAASLLFITAYIWIRFQRVVFGLAAVVALVHDVLVTLGAIALSAFLAPYLGILLIDPFKIGLTELAAFLTIIGYSLNDTIVIFDRIREVRGKTPRLTDDMVNLSINQTLSRTVLTSLTTLIVVVILYLFGGDVIHAFAFAMVIGMIAGTYSTVFIASPVLLWLIPQPKTA